MQWLAGLETHGVRADEEHTDGTVAAVFFNTTQAETPLLAPSI